MKPIIKLFTLVICSGMLFCMESRAQDYHQSDDAESWTFCSIPDFLNFDIEYPQEGWEDALGFILKPMKKDRLEVTLKEIDLINGKGRLWQQKKSKGPWDTITITEERKKEGFTPIGHVTIAKKDGKKSFESITGFFDEKNNP